MNISHNRFALLFLSGSLVPSFGTAHEHKQSQEESASQRPNILLLMVDDLRPELGCYGVEQIKTPNIDRLASGGTLFKNAYCNIPVSGASRASLLTGIYPLYPNQLTQYNSRADKDVPSATPISGWFTENGYYTISNGKVFHNIKDHADSWSEKPWRVNPDGYGSDWAEYNKWEVWMNEASGETINPKNKRGPYCESADVADSAYDDGKGALRTVADLKRLKEYGDPFFLACGFWRPHLPFNAPKRYWDMYRREDIQLADNRLRPEGLPKQIQGSQEIFSYARVKDTDNEAFQREAKHAYYASVSYVDAQIGLILDALDELGLAENTIVVLLGDHGWHLGENSFWGKHNLMDNSTRVPLIVRAPGMKSGVTKSVVEFVDIYPTLCELSGIEQPTAQLDGISFVPTLRKNRKSTKDAVYIQWEGGESITDGRYNYAEWSKTHHGERVITDRMLFDHRVDSMEINNLATKKRYRKVVERSSKFLREKRSSLQKQAPRVL